MAGSIKCISTPTAATVKVDGVLKGITPCIISNVAVGTRSVQFSKSGYLTQTKNVTVTAGGSANVYMTMVVHTGGVKCTSTPSGASVKVDGVSKGTTPCAFNVPVGTRSIQFSKSGYLTKTVNVTVSTGGVKTVNVTLVVLMGGVKCTSTPSGATVKVDGVKKGTTPCAFNIPIGKRSIQFSKTNYVTQTKSITVGTGGVQNVNVTLVAVTPPVIPPIVPPVVPPVIPPIIPTGSIICTSTPNAEVYLDDVYKGLSPLTIYNLEITTYRITFKHVGFVDQDQYVVISSEDMTKYAHATMVKVGKITIISIPPGAIIQVN